MKSSDMIRKLCMIENISISELARRIGQTPQNFNKKLKRDTVTFDEMLDIAAVNVCCNSLCFAPFLFFATFCKISSK